MRIFLKTQIISEKENETHAVNYISVFNLKIHWIDIKSHLARLKV